MEHPKAVGDRTTLAVITALHACGYVVAIPFGENSRYDLVVDDRCKLQRVQCKTGRLRCGAVVFKTCSVYAHHPNPKVRFRDYEGQIDAFAVYCDATSAVYLVPIQDVSAKHEARLRTDAPRNKQIRRVRFAADYEVATVTIAATAGLRATAGG